jgi:hypothetical protein
MTTQHMQPTATLRGRTVTFPAQRDARLVPWPITGDSAPIQFRIVAYVVDHNNQRIAESAPLVVRQDERSALRQEYLDQAVLHAAFTLAPPALDAVHARAEVATALPFPIEAFNHHSDYPNLVVLGANLSIGSALRDLWPGVRLAAAYRNPHAQSRLEGTLDDPHQTADASDFTPARHASDWPAEVHAAASSAPDPYRVALRMLYEAATREFVPMNHAVELHGQPLQVHVGQ